MNGEKGIWTGISKIVSLIFCIINAGARMLNDHDQQTVTILKEKILTITSVIRVIVFGSRARGDSVVESDLDVFIELTTLTPELRKKLYDIAWEVGFEQGLVISLFLASSTSLTDSLLAANPILRSIEAEGVLV
jgi:predicted nucleotidyltransferase